MTKMRTNAAELSLLFSIFESTQYFYNEELKKFENPY